MKGVQANEQIEEDDLDEVVCGIPYSIFTVPILVS